MLIRTKIVLSALISLVCVLVLVSVVTITNKNLFVARNQRTKIIEVSRAVFELNILTNDYLLHNKERVKMQWNQRYQSLQTLLNSIISRSDNEQKIINEIKDLSQVLETRFTDLENNVILSSLGEDGQNESLEKKLVSRIGIESQRMVDSAFSLSALFEDEISNMVNRAYVFGIMLVVILFVVIIFIASLFYKSIMKPIEKFHKAITQVSYGEYGRQLNLGKTSEIGQLSDAFDNMALQLKKKEDQLLERNKELLASQAELEEQSNAVLNVLDDVEEEKEKASREKDKMDTILQSIGDAVFVVDKDYKIILFNKAAERMSGIKYNSAIGKPYNEVLKFVYERGRQPNDKFVKEAIRLGKIQLLSNHTLLVRPDGIEVPVSDSAAPIKGKNGKIIGCVVAFRDVTEERRVDKAKTEFVSLASHQLRTPLTAISWYGEMLIKGEVGKLTDDQKAYLQKIYISNERMIGLVGALLNVSRIELGTFMVEPRDCDIVVIAKSVIGELKKVIEEKAIRLSVNFDKKLPKKLKVDDKLFRMIIQNLLSNAIKYTPPKGKVKLEIKKRNKDVEIIVSDNGYGIPKNQQDQVYKKLFRADNIKTKETEGTGLGLYLVKSILDNTGGKITFRSDENKGSKFHVSIPLEGMKKKIGTKRLSWEG